MDKLLVFFSVVEKTPADNDIVIRAGVDYLFERIVNSLGTCRFGSLQRTAVSHKAGGKLRKVCVFLV